MTERSEVNRPCSSSGQAVAGPFGKVLRGVAGVAHVLPPMTMCLEGQAHGLAVGRLGLAATVEQAVQPGVHVDLLAADADAARRVADGAAERAPVDLGLELVVAHG